MLLLPYKTHQHCSPLIEFFFLPFFLASFIMWSLLMLDLDTFTDGVGPSFQSRTKTQTLHTRRVHLHLRIPVYRVHISSLRSSPTSIHTCKCVFCSHLTPKVSNRLRQVAIHCIIYCILSVLYDSRIIHSHNQTIYLLHWICDYVIIPC